MPNAEIHGTSTASLQLSRFAIRHSALTGWLSFGGLLNATRDLDRQVFSIAPLLPRAGVVAHAWVAEETKRDIRVRRAIAALAVGHDLLVGRDPGPFVHRAKLGRGLEVSLRGEIARPFDVHGAGDCAAALRAHRGAVMFAVGPRV